MSEHIAPGGLYGYKNPPPSNEAALLRLQELELAVESIDVQLQHINPNDFSSEDNFRSWKSRTMGAAGHYRTEITYLQRWMGGSNSRAGQGVPASGYRAGVEQIRSEVARMVAEVRAQYKRVYVEGNMPQDYAAARQRRREISVVAELCTSFFKQLKEMGEAADISDEKLVQLRKPLSTLQQMEIQAELKLITQFFRENPEEGTLRVDWPLFLLSLVDRAVASGFILTDEERATTEEIREVKRSQPR